MISRYPLPKQSLVCHGTVRYEAWFMDVLIELLSELFMTSPTNLPPEPPFTDPS